MKRSYFFLLLLAATLFSTVRVEAQNEDFCAYVNSFIGSSNFGTTHPGAVCPNGMMSVSPFNVMGSELNKFDKDARWWSTPYEFYNRFFTGFSHVNLSGVGCPDLGSLLLMPTQGKLQVDYKDYGSPYTDEKASPGYYSNRLSKYGIKTEVTASMRSSLARFTFPKGESHILLNLGEGLTNESGASLKLVNDNEVEGVKLLGTFCYNPQAVFPIYFVMRVKTKPRESGYWKKQRPMTGVEAEWDKDNGRYKLYRKYRKEISGDDIGVFFSFDTQENEEIEVQMGVSFVSIENARLNLDTEQQGKDFDRIHKEARKAWNDDLGRIRVEGGGPNDKTVFYTALYHTLIHPNIVQDVNGAYPAMESSQIRTSQGNRYTVFSLWDTYRNVHQLLTLVYPERQIAMLRSMIDIYKEHGWLPKWELYGRETLTMEGDPAVAVIVDSWIRGLRNFDIETAYEAMRKSALTAGAENLLRPDNDDYMQLGYVPLREAFDNSVSHAIEYYIADWCLGQLARSLGKDADANLFDQRSKGYKHYYCPDYGCFRPRLPDGKFLSPFNPLQGMNFEPSPGFHEGNAWNYSFAVPHDPKGLIALYGGRKKFTQRLQAVFDQGYFDITNEPDIAYPYLFSHISGEEWRTQKIVRELLSKHFRNSPDGLPGNDDTGTLSAWAVFNMMGFYPDCPGRPDFCIVNPVFDKIHIRLDPKFYPSDELIISKQKSGNSKEGYVTSLRIDGRNKKTQRISHQELTRARQIEYCYTQKQAKQKKIMGN